MRNVPNDVIFPFVKDLYGEHPGAGIYKNKTKCNCDINVGDVPNSDFFLGFSNPRIYMSTKKYIL